MCFYSILSWCIVNVAILLHWNLCNVRLTPRPGIQTVYQTQRLRMTFWLWCSCREAWSDDRCWRVWPHRRWKIIYRSSYVVWTTMSYWVASAMVRTTKHYGFSMILQQCYRDITLLVALILLLKLIIRTFNCLMDDHAGVWSWCSSTSWN